MPIAQRSQGIAAYRQGVAGQLDLSGGLAVQFAKPSFGALESCGLIRTLNLSLRQNRQRLNRLYVRPGQAVQVGTLLAEGEQTQLYCPCSGTIQTVVPDKRKAPGYIEIAAAAQPSETPKPAFRWGGSTEENRRLVRQMGIWDSIQQGMQMTPPALDDQPSEVIVRCVFAEPGQIPGSIIIRKHLPEFIRGLKYLYELAGSYAPLIMTVPTEEGRLGQQIREQLRGQAFVHITTVPIRYPVENGLLLANLLGSQRGLGPDHFWVVDPQLVVALTEAIEKGCFWSHRYVSLIGPALQKPVALRVPLGAPLGELARPLLGDTRLEDCALLRGGLYTGKRAVPQEGLRLGDAVVWVVPETETPELLGWLHPGTERHSWTRTVLSGLVGKTVFRPRTLLRGSRRPCIGCGFCRDACPAGLYPHQLHRLVTHDLIEEAEQLGLLNCVECHSCSYGCVSKIELSHEIIHARRTLLQNEANGI